MAEDFISSVSSEEFDKALLGGLDAANGKFAKKEDIPSVPTKVSELENDVGYLKSFAETDPTVPAWAKTPEKPEYTAQEVGARPKSWTPSASDVGADPAGKAVEVVSLHNVDPDAHNDIRLLIEGLASRLNALADSDDTTLDQMSEIVAYIKSNKSLIDSITTSKVNVSDIINNLTTNVSNKPLSAAQGVILKGLIDSLSTGKLDVTAIADWAKAATKPSYTKSEVGLGNVDNVKQYSASNPPPYPVTSVNGKTGAVTWAVPEVVQATGDSEAAVMSQKAVTDALGYPPSYWFDELETKANEIRQAMEIAGRNKSAFLWYTDSHWTYGNSKVSPVLLRYLFNNTPLNKVNFGGDIVVNAQDRVNMAYLYNEWRSAIRDLPNHHSVVGNHDVMVDYPYTFLIAPEESADMVMGGDLYYYIDNPCEQTRYIYLDSGRMSISDEETAWLIAALNSALEGWHIVVISHIWFQYTNASAPTVGKIPAYMQKVLNLLDAYNAKKSGTITMVDAEYAYDFSNAVGAVEFCIGGHIHVDYDFTSTGGIPVILTASDTNQERSSDETEDSGTMGTITESAVFGIVANYDSREVSVIGVGRGGSRTVALQQEAGAYTNQIPISTDTDGSVYNGVGYADDTRLNSSGAPTAATSSYTGLDCTGFIPVKVGDVVRMKGMETRPDSSLAASSRFGFFDGSKAHLVNQTLNNIGAYDGVTDADGYLTQFTVPSQIISTDISSVAYMRVSVVGITQDSIITVNEEIV